MGRDQDPIAHACATRSFLGLREGAQKSLLQILPEQELPDLAIRRGGGAVYLFPGNHSIWLSPPAPMKPLYTSAPSKLETPAPVLARETEKAHDQRVTRLVRK